MIRITQGSYQWEAVPQNDPRVYLCKESSGGKVFNTYAIHADSVNKTVEDILKAKMP